ncbi:MAG: PocR ligand-binding domain-containing protein, partial [Deltaproteobacteria bacterium]
MIDPLRFEELLIVRKIKEKIRKWWRIELSFADATGFVVDHKKGVVIPPHSRLCEASLGCREGFGRCNRSIEKAVRDLAGQKEMKAVLVDQCHMGLHIIACPIVTEDRFHGAIFACGFLGEQAKGERGALVQGNALAEGLVIDAPEAAYAGVPTLSAQDMDYFKDLLETTVEEIVEFSRTVDQKEARIAQLSRELGGRYQFGNIVGKSAAMQRLFSVLEKVVDSESTVLVT